MNKLRLVVLFVSVMMLSVYFAGSASAEGSSIYGRIAKFNSAVFGVTGAQVSDGSASVAASSGGGGGGSPARLTPCGNYGDVNDDGVVTDTDSGLIAQYLLGNSNFTLSLERADVNGDDAISVADALLISQYVGGLRDTFPVCSEIACVDSDGGENYFVKGTATGPYGCGGNVSTYTDYCYGSGVIAEFYCWDINCETSYLVRSFYQCPEDSCVDGACVYLPPPPEARLDLALAQLTFTPAIPIVNQAVDFGVVVGNVGDVNVTNYSGSIAFGDGFNYSFSWGGLLSPGEYGVHNFTHNYSGDGTFMVIANVSKESDFNASNNVKVKEIIVLPPEGCVDSDGGENYFVKGTATGPYGCGGNVSTYTDYCHGGGVVGEFFCSLGRWWGKNLAG